MLKDFSIEKWNGNKIVIFGCGDHGKIIANTLLKNEIDDFLFCESVPVSERRMGKKIISLAELNIYSEANFIIGSGKFCIEIYEMLRKYKIESKNIFTGISLYRLGLSGVENPEKEAFQRYSYQNSVWKLTAYLNNGWYVNNLDLAITDICTLKCEKCCSLIPYRNKTTTYQSLEVLKSFENLLKTGIYIAKLNLIGGEPFLNEKLIREILIRYKNHPQIGMIYTITNGTIIPSAETLDVMSWYENFYVLFSNYGDLSIKLREAMDRLIQYNIPCSVFQNQNINDDNYVRWVDYGAVKHYKRTKEEYQEMYNQCGDRNLCRILLHGKLYLCGRIAYMNDLGLIPELPYTYVDFTKEEFSENVLKQQCMEVLFNQKYSLACEFCNIGENIEVVRAKQLP